MFKKTVRKIIRTGRAHKWLMAPCMLALLALYGGDTLVRNRRRLASVALACSMVLTMLPAAALAGELEGARSGLTACHPVHDESCGYVEAVEGHPCGHYDPEAGTYSCDPALAPAEPTAEITAEPTQTVPEESGEQVPEDTGTPTPDSTGEAAPQSTEEAPAGETPAEQEKTQDPAPQPLSAEEPLETPAETPEVPYVCDHTDGCGYVEAVEGHPCTHSCEVCHPDECVCGTLCGEGSVNEDCPICSRDLWLCAAAEPVMMLMDVAPMALEGDEITSGGAITLASKVYYVKSNVTITATGVTNRVGNSGITVPSGVTATIHIAEGCTLTVKGANGVNPGDGGGAGIYLNSGATLFLIGAGSLKASGGTGRNGGARTNGSNASYSGSNFLNDYAHITFYTGSGGNGGAGGGSGGAGIGGAGAAGGSGGTGGAGLTLSYGSGATGNTVESNNKGKAGGGGGNGNKGNDMGSLYVMDTVKVTASAGGYGSRGTKTALETRNQYAFWHGSWDTWRSFASGGGGGGGGSASPSAAIGGSGGGGGGGGGGASGSGYRCKSGNLRFYVGASGGGGGGYGTGVDGGGFQGETAENHIKMDGAGTTTGGVLSSDRTAARAGASTSGGAGGYQASAGYGGSGGSGGGPGYGGSGGSYYKAPGATVSSVAGSQASYAGKGASASLSAPYTLDVTVDRDKFPEAQVTTSASGWRPDEAGGGTGYFKPNATVTLTANYPDYYTVTWTGATPDPSNPKRATVSMTGGVNKNVSVTGEPTVKVVTNDTDPENPIREIYARGLPLVAEAGDTGTTLYFDKNRNGVVDAPDDVSLANMTALDNAPADGADLSTWTLYGGSDADSGPLSGSPSLTLNGGSLKTVYGGGKTALTGSTAVHLGGSAVVGDVYGGGDGGTVSGNTAVSVSGGPAVGNKTTTGIHLDSLKTGKVTVTGELTGAAGAITLIGPGLPDGTTIATADNASHLVIGQFKLPCTDTEGENIFESGSRYLRKDGSNLVVGRATMVSGVTPANYAGTYDGQAHSISVDLSGAADGATVTYSLDGTTYSADNPSYTDAGTYTVYFKVVKDDHYTVTGTRTVVINRRTVTASLDEKPADRAYDGTTGTTGATLKLDNVVSGETLAVTGSVTFADKNAGENKKVNVDNIALTGTEEVRKNYILAADRLTDVATTASITKKPVTLIWTGANKVYDGQPLSVSAAAKGSELVSGDVCGVTVTVAGDSGVTAPNAGAYTATAALDNSNYSISGGTTKEYQITKAPLTATYPGATVVYKDTIPASALTVAVTGFVGDENAGNADGYTAPTLPALSSQDVGSYELTPTGGSSTNYTFSYVSGTLNIANRSFNSISVEDYTGVYDGQPHGITIVNTDAFADNTAITYYSSKTDANNGSNALPSAPTYTNQGTYEVWFKVVANGFTSLVSKGTITIQKKNVTPYLDGTGTKVYDGTTSVPSSVTLKFDGVVQNETLTASASVLALESKNAGSRAVNATNIAITNPNYTLTTAAASKAGAVTVSPKTLSPAWTGHTGLTYTGRPAAVTLTGLTGFTGTLESGVQGDTVTATVTGGNKVNAGSYTATATLDNENYNLGTPTQAYTINKKELTAKFKDESVSFGQTPKLEIDVTGFVNSETALTAAGYVAPTIQTNPIPTSPSETPIVLQGGSALNYTFNLNHTGKLTITKASMAGQVSATEYNGAYDGQPHGITVTHPDGATVTYYSDGNHTTQLTGGNEKKTDVGTYTIYYKVTRDGYEDVTGSKTIVITPKTVTPEVDTVTGKTYDGNTTASGTLKLSAGHKVDGDDVTVTGTITFTTADAGENKAVNVAGITLGGTKAANYQLSVTSLSGAATTAEITPLTAQLAWREVTAGAAKTVSAVVRNLIGDDVCAVTVEDGALTTPGDHTARATALSNGNYALPADAGDKEHGYNVPVPPAEDSKVPTVQADNLGELFNTDTYKNDTEATEAAAAGDIVEFRLTAEEALVQAEIDAIKTASSGQTVGVMVDLSLARVITPASGGATDTKPLTEVDGLLEIKVKLPQSAQGRSNYRAFRYHDAGVTPPPPAEPANPVSELKLLADGDTPTEGSFRVEGEFAIIYARKFSTYAVTYRVYSSSGNSGSGSQIVGKPITEKNPDGSTTTVTEKKDGSVERRTVYPNGVIVDSVEGKDGAVSASVTAPKELDGLFRASFPSGNGNTVLRTWPDGREEVVTYSLVEDGVAYVLLEGDAQLQIVTRSGGFTDMAGHKAQNAADFGAARGLWTGTMKGSFNPNVTMDRAMMVTILHRLAGTPDSAGSTFFDVARNSYSREAVSWAVETGITNGVGGGRFAPDVALTKEQMVVMLYRYCSYSDLLVPPTPEQRDELAAELAKEGIEAWAYDAIMWAVNAGLLELGSDGDLTAPISRGEAATILHGYVGYLVRG